MADSTFYRAEIVIDINDEAAVQRARRAETRVNQVLDRMERRGRVLDRMVATPTLSVRDRATQMIQRAENSLHRLTNRTWGVVISARDEVSGTLKRITGSLFSLKAGMVALATGAGVGVAIGYPLKLAGEMEQANIAFSTMLGSGQKAQKFLGDLADFAVATPFEMPQLRDASRRLLAFGFGVEKVIPMLTSLGNASSGLGLGEEGLNRMVLAIGQMRAKAKVSADEMLQLTEAGVPAWDILAKSMGKSTAEVMKLSEKGLIAANKAIDALLNGMNERFPKMMELQSRSLFGLFSTIKDFANLKFFWAFGEGIRQAAVPALQRFVDMLDKNEGSAKKIQDRLMGLGRTVGDWVVGRFEQLYKWVDKLTNDKAFQKMDWGDKIVYVLDEMIKGMDKWVTGEGGNQAEKVFVKLAEIATRAWLTAIGGMAKGSVDALLSGNIVGAGGLAAGGAVLGGGMLIRGGIGAGKGVYNAGKWTANKFGYGGAARVAEAASEVAATTSTAAQATTRRIPRPGDVRAGYQLMRESGESRFSSLRRGFGLAREAVTSSATVPSAPRIPSASVASVTEAASGASRASRVLSTFSKVASKVAIPLAVATEAYDIYKAKDKVKASAQSMGGLSGAAAGAAIGSIVPVVGTVLGSIIGGGIGYFGGKWAAGKAVDAIRKPSAQAGTAQMGQMNTAGFLDSEVYQPFANIVNRADSWGRNLIGNFCIGRDSAGMSMGGWLNSQVYSPFASIVDRATSWGATLMNNFAAGMQSVKIAQPTIPTPSVGGASVPVTKHAAGGILTRPHLGLVAEAGPEAIIPLSSGRRSHALQLWQQAGEMLGVVPHAEGGIFGSLKRFFSNDKVQAAGNRTENAAVGFESTRSGYEKAVHGIHRNYNKKIAKTSTIEEAERVRRIAHDAKNLSRKFSAITKTLSRVAVPLALFASAAEIAGSSDKKQTLVKELGSTLGAMAGGALAGAAGGALVGAGIASPLTALIGAAGGAAVGAFGGQSLASNMYGRYTKHAAGGILTRPHLGLVAEAGPESIIPLSVGRRGKAMDLWQKTGEMLGVRPYALGGFAGPVPAIAGGYVAPVPPVPMVIKGGGQSNVSITVDGVNINVSGKDMEIDEDGLALRIGREIVKSVKQAFENRA